MTYMKSLLRVFATPIENIKLSLFSISNESLITRARNTLVGEFLKNDAFTHLLFIDADIGFEPEAISRVVHSGHDVVGCIYPKKHYDFDKFHQSASGDMRDSMNYVVNVAGETSPDGIERTITNGFIQVHDIGTGFMLISRRAILKMVHAHPELRHDTENDKGLFALFDTLIDEKQRYLSEDWSFCKRWRNIGGEIYADLTQNLSHAGNHVFEGNLYQSLQHRGER